LVTLVVFPRLPVEFVEQLLLGRNNRPGIERGNLRRGARLLDRPFRLRSQICAIALGVGVAFGHSRSDLCGPRVRRPRRSRRSSLRIDFSLPSAVTIPIPIPIPMRGEPLADLPPQRLSRCGIGRPCSGGGIAASLSRSRLGCWIKQCGAHFAQTHFRQNRLIGNLRVQLPMACTFGVTSR